MAARILQVFNRYVHKGGEEMSVDRIFRHLGERHEMSRCFFDSKEWTAPGAPSRFSQMRRLFHNPESKARFLSAVSEHHPDATIFHNIYPVGSPSLYQAALEAPVPVIQFMHNFRPFSVGGTLHAKGRLLPEALRGSYGREILLGAWQDSIVKSFLVALMLRRLHRSGWLHSVKAWVGISEFIRDRLIESGVPSDRVFALRHSWDAMPEAPVATTENAYLFLGRLVEVKGVQTLLDAWSELARQLGPRTPRLQIAGEGPLEPLVRRRAREHPSIQFLGLLDGQAKSEALRRCRAVVVPSLWWEPLGLVVYEAFDHAKPVLAARSGGLTETVQQDQTGLLHAPGSVPALVRDVQALESRTAEQRAAMGRAGRAWLLREASPARWNSRFDEILAQVIGVRREA
jgi:glycosyltransferase involved in cell wall biosynthesis